jgi:hypothetical protein
VIDWTTIGAAILVGLVGYVAGYQDGLKHGLHRGWRRGAVFARDLWRRHT